MIASVITDAAGTDWMIYHAIDVNKPYFAGSWTRRPAMIDRIDHIVLTTRVDGMQHRLIRNEVLGEFEQAGLVVDVAVLDARRLHDELARALLERLLVGIARVVTAHELVERGHELVVGQDVVGVPHPVSGDRCSCRRPRRHSAGSWSHDRGRVY